MQSRSAIVNRYLGGAAIAVIILMAQANHSPSFAQCEHGVWSKEDYCGGGTGVGISDEEREAVREELRAWKRDNKARKLTKKGDKARQRGRCTDADDYYCKAPEVEPSQQLTNYIKSRQDSVSHCFGNARVWMGMTREFAEGAVIRTPKGKILKPQKLYHTPVPFGSTVITGPNGPVRIILVDGSGFTVSVNGETVLDEFVYDPDIGVQRLTLNVLKGAIRFVTGKHARRNPDSIRGIDTSAFYTGIRGTDVEVSTDSKGNGHVILYESEIDVTEHATGRLFSLAARQWMKFENGRIVGYQ